MSDVTRLPVQHPMRPHCPRCKRDVPTFERSDVLVNVEELGDFQLEGITWHIRCTCGKQLDLTKNARVEPV